MISLRSLRGLSWGHRRATDPIYAATRSFCREHSGISMEWDHRPLSGFVNEKMSEVVGRYDLISFDHPFSGTVVAENLFVPLDRLPNLLGRDKAHLYAVPR